MEWLGEKYDFKSGAILNFNKPIGKTSFWIVKKVRNIINTKVGHAGTLDPFAEGVLILCTGKATKQISCFMNFKKKYVGEIQLGAKTDSDDKTGEVIEEKKVPKLTLKDLECYSKNFIGEISQIPPMYSAKKVNGTRLYKLARAGKVIERKPSLVTVDEFNIISFKDNKIKISITCSKGTYIRSIARDLGETIGCGGYLESLVRTDIGKYNINSSLTLSQFEEIVNSI